METNNTIRYQELENALFAAILADPKVVIPIIAPNTGVTKLGTHPGTTLLSVIRTIFHKHKDVPIAAVIDQILALKIGSSREQKLQEMLMRASDHQLTDTPQKTATFIMSQIHEMKISEFVSTELSDIQRMLSENASSDLIVSRIDSLYEQMSNTMGKQEKNALSSIVADVININKPTPRIGVPTGYKLLDTVMYGLRPGLHVVIGDSGDGKSTFLCNVARNIVQAGYKVLVLNIEMSQEEWLYMTMAMESQVDISAFYSASWSKDEQAKKRVEKAANLVHCWEKRYYFEFIPGIQTDVIRHHITNYVYREGVDVIIYDHIKSKEDDDNRYNSLGNLTTLLKNMSGRLEIPILATAQARRSYKENVEFLKKSDIADSYDIVRNANTILGIQSIGGKSSTSSRRGISANTAVNVIKNRSGEEGGVCNIAWNRPIATMEDLSS
jgi:replicative DNA helicase